MGRNTYADMLPTGDQSLADRCREELSALFDPVPAVRGVEYEFMGANLELQTFTGDECIIEGPADTGKTIASLAFLNNLSFTYHGLQSAIIRKVKEDMYSTVLATFRKKILTADSGVRAFGGERPQWFDYPNGSRIYIAGMDRPGKVLSGEFDMIYVNQAEELALHDWETLGSRVTGRAGNFPYAILLGDCNPAGPTHWIKTRAAANVLTFMTATHRDNPEIYDISTGELTAAGELRLSRLKKRLSGSRLARLFHGLWVSPEGAIYDVFDDEKHKVKAFDPPLTWPRVVGVDPFGAHVAAIFLAFDPAAGVLHAYREYLEPFGVTTPKHVANMLELAVRETIFAWVGGGPSERQWRTDYGGAGMDLMEPPISDVWAGIDRVYQLLDDFSLVIHDGCVHLLSQIGEYSRKVDKKTGEHTDVIANKGSFDMLDALRYIVAWLTEPGESYVSRYNPVRIGDKY